MEKNRIHKIKSGKNTRMSFAGQRDVLEMPNLVDIQKASYEWFLKDGLKEIFEDISPITEGFSQYSLSFLDYKFEREKPNHSIEKCKEIDATYSAPLKVQVRLINKETNVILGQNEVYLGDLPLMTDTGSFVINGAERVIVSQIVRSPGIYYELSHEAKSGKELYACTVIPNRGAWLEYETDQNDLFFVKVDRNNKVPVSTLIRALFKEYSSDEAIKQLFGEEPKIVATLAKDDKKTYEQSVLFLYSKLRPGETVPIDNARTLIEGMLFEPKRYDLAHVGRYKFNKKMNFKYRLDGQELAEDVVDEMTGELIATKGTVLDRETAQAIQNTGVEAVLIKDKFGIETKVLSNRMVEAWGYLNCKDADELYEKYGIKEMVSYPVLMDILEKNLDEETLKLEIMSRKKELVPPHITKQEILASISYLLNLEHGIGKTDDIDHLGNRRIRAVGELLQNQYRIGMTRLERVVRERMTQIDQDIVPQNLINVKTVSAAIKEFFGSSQLSQFMDQNNPLSELTHKRRLSALGPGGLSRERAGFEVRDVHYTHYGRMCPIETPEGPNIGLINSLASYARVNEYGFIEAPYRLVDKSDPENPRVTDEVRYFAADEEDDFHVAQANTELDENGYFVKDSVSGRFREETREFAKTEIDLMDVSPKMVFSVATSMIPFLENDDANRALMGSNMQRQAVPLMITEAPVVDTGLAEKVAKDSGVCVLAKNSGIVIYSASDKIIIKTDDGETEEYALKKFERSNQSNSYNQKPIVVKGEHVEKDQVIADGPSTCNGEIALGRNPLIGFMTWEGYNYEDAVLLSERLVQDDVFTSIHVEEYEIDARDNSKIGKEEITREIPSIGQDAIANLDEHGIIRIGAEVRAGDILVGKVTPKGETEQSAEERLLRAIFNEKARDVRDTSLRVPHGAYGTVIYAQSFTRQTNAELPAGVLERVRVYIAQKRKISVGDKMAGRHGNKGVVSRVLPVEDMPFLPNGRPLDIVLNPLGVPSRMNIGQILEIHLSLAARVLGIDISTPVFAGAKEKEIGDLLEVANDYVNTEFADFKKKYKNMLSDDLLTYLGEHLENRELWKGVPITRDGKVQLRDGRTGEPFDSKTTIGHMHYLKLHHLVDDKIHARSTGPYSLVTQQPLGGKAQFGGQRFGEMEVWALEAYGASYTLQEILTVKSDDVVGRVKSYEAIIKGENIPTAGVPESFKVLIKELQALALDVSVLRDDGTPMEITEDDDTDDMTPNLQEIMSEGDVPQAKVADDFVDAGYQEQAFTEEGKLEAVEEEPDDSDVQ